jgi:DNA adenine methylase
MRRGRFSACFGLEGEAMKRPLLRWAGSKRAQLPEIEKFWPDGFDRYLEPFCGSCAALIHCQPGTALMNDINAELINFWTVIKASAQEVYARVSKLQNDSEVYYGLRAIDPASLDSIGRAVRFWYLNRYSFNGLYRTNRKGQYNVPYGGKRCGSVPSEDDFSSQSSTLGSVDFTNLDFEEFVLSNAQSGDFFYLDPPYAIKGSRVSGEYDQRAFKSGDVERLIRSLGYIDRIGAKYLLSYADDEDLARRLGNNLRGRYDVRRRIAGFRDSRVTSQELVFSNYEIA